MIKKLNIDSKEAEQFLKESFKGGGLVRLSVLISVENIKKFMDALETAEINAAVVPHVKDKLDFLAVDENEKIN